jgi:predicted signal transduction protein with EAL and GGDEF domain
VIQILLHEEIKMSATKIPNTVKVTMNLTDRDVDNTDKIRKVFHARSNAAAVSDALSITATLVAMLKDGNEILVRNKKGELEKLVFTGLDH